MEPMVPSAEARTDELAKLFTKDGGLIWYNTVPTALEQAYRDGFAACLALLRESTDELVSTILAAAKRDGVINLRDALRAAADAIDSGEGA